VDRQTRKDLKTDKFAEDVVDVFGWASAHKNEVVRYGAALIALVLIVVGVPHANCHARGSARESAARRRRDYGRDDRAHQPALRYRSG